MDYPGNNSGFSPTQNPSAKKKRKTSNNAGRRGAVVSSSSSNSSSRLDCVLHPALFATDSNGTLVASNPFDDNPSNFTMSQPPRGPPPYYPGNMQATHYMDFMMASQGIQQQPVNMSYASTIDAANSRMAMMSNLTQNFGQSMGHLYSQPMTALPHLGFPTYDPPPYPNPQPCINTLSRIHMSMGNVNVSSPHLAEAAAAAAAAVAAAGVVKPSVKLNLPMQPTTPAAAAHIEEPQQAKKRKPPPLYIPQGPVQPYQPLQFSVAGHIRQRPPMSQLPSSLIGKLPYAHTQPHGRISNSILQSRLTKLADPAAGSTILPGSVDELYADALPNPCGGCDLDVLPGEEAVFCAAGCDFWFHRECSGLTVAAHHLLLVTAYTEWVCDFCCTTKGVPSIKFTF